MSTRPIKAWLTAEGRYATMQIILIEDHTLFRDGMKILLRRLDENAEILEASGCEEVLNGRRKLSPDLVLLDLGLPGLGGAQGVRAMRKMWPDSNIVVLSGNDDPEMIRLAIGSGACGYILKTATAQEMITALELVIAGGVYVPTFARDVLTTQAPPAITGRQRQVLTHMAHGLSNRAIAEELDMAESTVRGHVSALLDTFGAANRTEATRIAFEQGLVERKPEIDSG